jgi:hypothetical protein
MWGEDGFLFKKLNSEIRVAVDETLAGLDW